MNTKLYTSNAKFCLEIWWVEGTDLRICEGLVLQRGAERSSVNIWNAFNLLSMESSGRQVMYTSIIYTNNVNYSHSSRILTALTVYSADTYKTAIKFIIDSHLWARGGLYFGQLLGQTSISHGIVINRGSIQEGPRLSCPYSSPKEIAWNASVHVQARNVFRALCSHVIIDSQLLHVTSCFVQTQGTSNSICVQRKFLMLSLEWYCDL